MSGRSCISKRKTQNSGYYVNNGPMNVCRILYGTASDLKGLAHLALKRTQMDYVGRTQRRQKIKMWEALQQLGVRNIPKLYGNREIDDDFVVFAENFKDGEMSDYINDICKRGTDKETREGLEELFHLAMPSLLETLIDMHKANYIHRDMKSENILIEKDTNTQEIVRIAITGLCPFLCHRSWLRYQ